MLIIIMNYVFIEPISMTSLFVLFIAFLVIFVYLTYLFYRKVRISNLKKIPTAFVIGFSNSGRSFIIKELCKCKKGFSDKILDISYSDLVHEGIIKLKVIDHQNSFNKDGKVDHRSVDGLKGINPRYIISIIDVSPFSEPVENQINFANKISEKFKEKKVFIVANKVDKNSKNKLKKIEESFGKNFYKIRINKPSDAGKLRKDLIKFLETT